VNESLKLSFQPPINWPHLLNFYRKRAVQGIEEVGEDYYYRTFICNNARGWFNASLSNSNTLTIDFQIDDSTQRQNMVSQIRRLFDLDADITLIEQHLASTTIAPLLSTGLRIPGVWNPWEAGIRAIFGQQISITAAITLLNKFVESLNQGAGNKVYFPTPQMVAAADLNFFKMPQARKDTLVRFARYMINHSDASPEDWIALKGIGPWTISYAKLRGLSEPDCFLSTDLVIKKAIANLDQTANTQNIKDLTASLSPWGSYATFHCWNSLS
jgi:AraC family transcriptional regulator of adaptative response / DNA-3-methyladenine glycosylase II